MTVQNSTYRADTIGNGVTKTFPVPFKFLDDSHVRVILTDLTTGSATVLVLNSDYTVSGAGEESGGSITTTASSAYTSRYTITRLRNIPLTQETSYTPNDPFPAKTHEAALDRLTMMAQQVQEQVDRSLKVEDAGTPVTIPTPVDGKVLGFIDGSPAWVAEASAQFQDDLAQGSGSDLVGHEKDADGAVAITLTAALKPIVTPEMFGAVAGSGVSSAVRSANRVAIQAAWDFIKTGGRLLIPDTYEINGPLVVCESNSEMLYEATEIQGGGLDSGKLRVVGSHGVIDGVGARFLTIRGVTLECADGVAEYALLLGRTSGSQSAEGIVLDNVKIRGSYTIAPLVTLAAETLRVIGCHIWNESGGALYETDVDNAVVQATSARTIVSGTNTDIRFEGCYFYAYADGSGDMAGVNLRTQFVGGFHACSFIANPVASGHTATLTALHPGSADTFNGKVSFESCHFEATAASGATVQGILFDNDNSTTYTYSSIDVHNCNFVLKGTGTKTHLAYTNRANAQMILCSFAHNATPDVENTAPLDFCYMLRCRVQAEWFPAAFHGAVYDCDITVRDATYDANVFTRGSTVKTRVPRTMTFGVAPVVFGQIPVGYSGNAAERIVVGPTITVSQEAQRGELATLDPTWSWVPTASQDDGDILTFFDGKRAKPVGLYQGAPAHSAVNGVKGAMLFDTGYLYVCTASGTTGSIGTVTGSIEAGSRVLTVNTASWLAALNDAGNGCFINIAGVTGTKQILGYSGTTLYLSEPADVGVTGASVTLASPVWARIALDTSF